VHFVLAEGADQGLRDLIGATGFGHHFAEHGAQRKDDADETEHAAEAVLERLDDGADRHAGGQAEERGRDGQGDEGVNLEFGDQEDQTDYRDHCIEQQVGVVGHAKHWGVSWLVVVIKAG
jgi:hypothetical protein